MRPTPGTGPMRVPYFDDDPHPPREVPCGTLRDLPAGGMIARLARRVAVAEVPGKDPRAMTRDQLKRHRRNLMIALGSAVGLSGPFLADAFGLPKSRINEILKEYAAARRE